HQLLEEIGLLVGTLGRAEARQARPALALADLDQAGGGARHRLFPGGLAEVRKRMGGIDLVVGRLRYPVLADQRHGEAVGMVGVVEAEAALDAEPRMVGRAVLAGDVEDLVVLDVIGELAADAAERAEAVDRAVGPPGALLAVLVEQGRRHQRARRAGLPALAAGDAGAVAHRIVEVEDDLLAMAAAGHADHVVDLDLAAGADAEVALDAGVEIDRHRRMADVAHRMLAGRKAAGRHADLIGPVPELRIGIVRRVARRLVGEQQLEHHAPRRFGPLRGHAHLHTLRRLAQAGGREHALALDLDHAGAAVAVGPIAGRPRVAEMGNGNVVAVGDLPDRLALAGFDLHAVDGELDTAHRTIPTSEGKNFITDVTALGAAWPSPQIEASRMATDNSLSSASFQPR